MLPYFIYSFSSEIAIFRGLSLGNCKIFSGLTAYSEHHNFMVQTYHRVILTRCTIGENSGSLCRFIAKEFALPLEKAEYIVHHPPVVLGDLASLENVIFAIKHLAKFHAESITKPVIVEKRLPFAINPRQLKWISKEFSKTMRACVDTLLFYVHVTPSTPNQFLPSLLGKKDEIEDAFRYSDSLFVIDDSTFILLGFASDRDGADVVFDKITYCMENYIRRDAVVHIGLASIPEDGKSFYDVVAVAKQKMRTFKNDMTVAPQATDSVAASEAIPHTAVSYSDLQLFTLCFNKARGQFYNELTELPPDVLWGALSKVSVADQKKFFLKLPHESPLTSYLAEKITTQADETDVHKAKKSVRKVISKMQLVESLNDRKKNRKKVIALMSQVDSIFIMPSHALEVYRIASKPDADLDEVVESILLAPALTIKILKLVNSPFYALSQKVASIKDAVIILGMDEVINMAFGISLSTSFLDADLKGLMDPGDLWRHAMETALIAKYLCRELHQFKGMGVFTAGLLHDLGKVYLIENFPDLYAQVIERSDERGITASALEQEIMGIDHGGIGKLIGDAWNLPDALVQAVAFHHQPSSAMNYSAFAAMIGFADYLANIHHVHLDSQDMERPAMVKAKQLFKVDHMIILKKIFPDFGNRFIEQRIEAVSTVLNDNSDLIRVTST